MSCLLSRRLLFRRSFPRRRMLGLGMALLLPAHVSLAATAYLQGWRTGPLDQDRRAQGGPSVIQATASGKDGSLYVAGLSQSGVTRDGLDPSPTANQVPQAAYIARLRPDGGWDSAVIPVGWSSYLAFQINAMTVVHVGGLDYLYVVGDYFPAGNAGFQPEYRKGFFTVLVLTPDHRLGEIQSSTLVLPEDLGSLTLTAVAPHPTLGAVIAGHTTDGISNEDIKERAVDRGNKSKTLDAFILAVDLTNPRQPQLNRNYHRLWGSKYTDDHVTAIAVDDNGGIYVSGRVVWNRSIDIDTQFSLGLPKELDFTEQSGLTYRGLDQLSSIPFSYIIKFSPTAPFASSGSPIAMRFQPTATASSRKEDLPTYQNDRVDAQALCYQDGWLYFLENYQTGGPNGSEYNGPFGARVLKLDTSLVGWKYAEIGVDVNAETSWTSDPPSIERRSSYGQGLRVDEAGDVYVSGIEGESGATLWHRDGGVYQVSADKPIGAAVNDLTVASSAKRFFVAKLSKDWKWDWIERVEGAVAGNLARSFVEPVARSGKSSVWWAGGFSNGRIALGNGNQEAVMSSKDANTPAAFATLVVSGAGTIQTAVALTFETAYPPGGSQVSPPPGRSVHFVGATLDVAVPARVFVTDENNLVIQTNFDDPLPVPLKDPGAAQRYRTRATSTGFTVVGRTESAVVEHGNENHYSFTLNEDTRLRANWKEEFALDVASIVDQGTSPGAEALSALGDPSPPSGRAWILKGAEVAPSVEGTVLSPVPSEDGTRYQVTSYAGTGPAPTSSAQFAPAVGRIQIGDGRGGAHFLMTSPASLTYHWKKQYRIQVSTSSEESKSLPVIVDPMNPHPEPIATGSGDFWFEEGSGIKIGAPQKDADSGLQLKGWMNAQWPVGTKNKNGTTDSPSSFPAVGQETTPVMTDVFDEVLLNQKYWLKTITMSGPARVTWTFGDPIYYANVAIGDAVTLPHFKDASGVALNVSLINTNLEPTIRVVDSPPGSTTTDMQVWDQVARRAYPLRPGIYFADWTKRDGSTGKIVTQVASGFPGELIQAYDNNPGPSGSRFPGNSHYRHVAKTPPVDLDPDPNDTVTFVELKYAATNEARVVDHRFTAPKEGKAVLLFSQASGGAAATGDLTRETLFVRVAQTRAWDSVGTWTSDSGGSDSRLLAGPRVGEIGSKLTSAADTAGLHKACVLSDTFAGNIALYHRGLYGNGTAAGPVFPVNRWPTPLADLPAAGKPTLDEKKALVVVWYERSPEGILWPYQPEYFNDFTWPTPPTEQGTPTNLKRMVVASRIGSEGVDKVGNPQLSFDPALYDQVAIYQQPDRTQPGFNPNEEHALIAPSFAYGDSPNPPPTAYALRNDLNVSSNLIAAIQARTPGTTLGTNDYTSEPYVLVQYHDLRTNEWNMAVYAVDLEDPTVGTRSDAPHAFEVPLTVAGLEGTLAEVSVDLDLTNPGQTGTEQEIWLRAPDGSAGPGPGTKVRLVAGLADQAALHGTTLEAGALMSLAEGVPPYTGRFQPVGNLAEFLAGDSSPINGQWTLVVSNSAIAAPRPRLAWSLTLTLRGQDGALTPHRIEPRDHSRTVFPYTFNYRAKAGEPIIAPYPLNLVIGASPCIDPVRQAAIDADVAPVGVAVGTTYQADGSRQRTYWVDHKGQGWAVSGDGVLFADFFYPLRADFWYPSSALFKKLHLDSTRAKDSGDCVAFAPRIHADAQPPEQTVLAVYDDVEKEGTTPSRVQYVTQWPADLPTLKVGETLTFAGGEYHADIPAAPGLPGVLGWSAGEVVYDSQNKAMDYVKLAIPTNSLARLAAPLEPRLVDLPLAKLPSVLQPANKRTTVKGTRYLFDGLSASLKKRVFYDYLAGKLGIRGYLADRTLGDADLTATPPPVYVLEPNILTEDERQALLGLVETGQDHQAEWAAAVNTLYKLSGNPAQLDLDGKKDGPDAAYLIGIDAQLKRDAKGQIILDSAKNPTVDRTQPLPAIARGPGIALFPNQDLLDPDFPWSQQERDPRTGDDVGVGYLTLAENNHPDLGAAPVTLHVIKIRQDRRYRGAIKTILSDNVFDEKITLRHSGDFGANATNLVFQWWLREEDGTERPLPTESTPDPWVLFGKSGLGRNQVDLAGTGEIIVRDNLFFARYRHRKEVARSESDWLDTLWRKYGGEWAGAANSPDIEGHYRPQLVQGWVKRVLDAVNPYEARIQDFENTSAPATYASMIQQFGGRYEGPVALNPDKDVIENVGLIELYQTILERAADLTINLSQPATSTGVQKALMLAATRLMDFHTILGNEAYADAQDPTIGFGSGATGTGPGSLAPAIFSFQNMVGSLLDEELDLLRGQDDTMGRPVYNRLMWNFTKGEGEAAYALNYNLTDVTHDGFINELDAQRLYPQGHGDAWGHYLTALTTYYQLLTHPYFNWVPQSELYSLQDVVFRVDYLDERKFARAAAAKARVGAEVVRETYRAKYVADPDGQWQGYLDPDPQRAWGVTEWARRAGQGALFDWITANALLPAHDTNETHNALQRIDRTTVTDLAQISANFGTVQTVLDDANNGLNPLGLDNDVVSFDLDPTFNFVGSTAQIGRTAVQEMTHFKQIYERALATLNNAKTAFDAADQFKHDLRAVGETVDTLRQDAIDHDLDYRNRLIEIFGTPYDGQIGSGKTYPAGYNGPDLLLFQYVDANAVGGKTMPAPSTVFTTIVSTFKNYITGNGIAPWLNPTGAGADRTISDDFRDTFATYFLNDVQRGTDGTRSGTAEDPTSSPPPYYTPEVLKLALPATAGSYSFQAPAEWGQRAAVGELQSLISDMVQTQASLAFSLSNYEAYLEKLKDMVQLLVAQNDHFSITVGAQRDLRDTIEDLNIRITVERGLSETVVAFADLTRDIEESQKEFLPTVVGTANDPSFGGRFAARFAGAWVQNGLRAVSMLASQAADLLERKKEVEGIANEIAIAIADAKYEIAQQLQELEQELRNESTQRLEIFRIAEQLQQQAGQYRAKLQEGVRLLEERRNFNIRTAVATQQNRYQDYVFRAARSAALEKYRAAFDLAARYVYLAAKAYDYETSLAPNDPGSVETVLEAIMKARTLGELVDTEPVLGGGGLADAMATLRDNFAILETRMGFNNPSLETQLFSLREGLFRIQTVPDPDPVYRTGNQTVEAWLEAEAKRNGYTGQAAYLEAKAARDDAFRAELARYVIEDLNQVPEYRRHCRPFANPASGKLPGLVIPFSSATIAGQNFFGRELAGGDAAFDPTLFATKIFASAVWFKGYDTAKLATTPRVYLVPVGLDVMTIPDSDAQATRVWRVLDQSIPVPHNTSRRHLADPDWIPVRDSLSEPLAQIRRFPTFVASTTDPGSDDEVAFADATINSRLIGRSVWNTQWLLIIPGLSMRADGDAALEQFLEDIEDIKFYFSTYGYSGN